MAEARRTCVVGRDEHPRTHLVRLVAAPDGAVVVDVKGSLPGRGVWVLPTAERVAGLRGKQGAIARQLGANFDADAIAASIREVTVRGVLDGLSLGAAAGALVVGHDRLVEALVAGRVDLVGTASDAAERTLRHLQQAAAEGVRFVELPLSSQELGTRLGRGSFAAVGVPTARPVTHLRRQLRRLAALG